jgi:crotonobetainyl-CoA:carnitine CoA-transferase CaiB-like acyl-CoA transferase
VLAALVRRGVTGSGAVVETSLLEALLDLQFEVLATHLNDGGRPPRRAAARGAHAYLAAPYGVYRALDGWLALAMTPLPKLGAILGLDTQPDWNPKADVFGERDALGEGVAACISRRRVADWLAVLEPADVWCAEVRDWPGLMQTATFEALGMIQEVTRGDGLRLRTLRVPLRIDGQRPMSDGRAAPLVGEHSERLFEEFGFGNG